MSLSHKTKTHSQDKIKKVKSTFFTDALTLPIKLQQPSVIATHSLKHTLISRPTSSHPHHDLFSRLVCLDEA